MATAVNLKNRGPSPFAFTHKGKAYAIPSGGVGGPFDSTVLRNEDVYARLTSGGLISFGDNGPTAEMATGDGIAIADPNHIVKITPTEKEGTVAVSDLDLVKKATAPVPPPPPPPPKNRTVKEGGRDPNRKKKQK